MLLVSLVGLGAAGITTPIQAADALIEGGADAAGFSYEWTITNQRDSIIVQIEIPHHGASLLFAPEGWTVHCTNLVGLGVADPTGICTASVDHSGEGIAPHRTAKIRMQIASAGAKRGRGNVLVRFADGTEVTITDIEIPTAEPGGDRNVPLYGLGAIMVIIIAARSARRRWAVNPS